MPTEAQNQKWDEEELSSVVDSYLWMLGQEQSGKTYNKAEINRELRNGSLSARTEASIEYRMQNISAAMEELCLPRIKGYLPAKNIGTGIKDKICSLLASKGVITAENYAPSAEDAVLVRRVSSLRKHQLDGIPRGIEKPVHIESHSKTFIRDPLVKAWVLQKADGVCEGCGNPAPFIANDGFPFLEVHHVHPLADGGSDRISNAVALCPNCHRRCHTSADRKEFTSSLYERVARLVVEPKTQVY